MTIITPLVLLGVMLIVQFGLAYHAQNVLSGAAQDGAASAARRDGTPAGGEAVAGALIDVSASALLASSSITAERIGNRVVVTVTGEVVSLIPFVDSLTVRASASSPIEDFFPQGKSS